MNSAGGRPDRAGARTDVLEGLGHWWMVQDPARGARGPRQLLGKRSSHVDRGPSGTAVRWRSGSLDYSSCAYWKDTGRRRPKKMKSMTDIDEPEKCDPHAHRDRRGAVAGLVVLLFQRRHPRLQARRHVGGDGPESTATTSRARRSTTVSSSCGCGAEERQRRHRTTATRSSPSTRPGTRCLCSTR